MGNKDVAPVEMIGDYKMYFDSGLCIVLGNVCYSANMARNIISFNALYLDGFYFKFDNGSILVYKDSMFYFKVSPYKGILETTVSLCDSSILNIDSSKNGLDKKYLWHCRLGHISKKRIAKLQLEGGLESFDITSYDECESCLL